MIVSTLLLLLPVAAASGWYAAKKSLHKSQNGSEQFTRNYLVGLNYLLNEQPDKAVDVFIKMLEVDSETVETHLALGTLFRRRGEVDRAIRIHQNLIARPQLPMTQRSEALLALGQDYLRAGVLDRAERIFLELAEIGDKYKKAALHHLLGIYQQQKNWEAAITTANKLVESEPSIKSYIAHYCCELAADNYAQGRVEQTRSYLKQALQTDRNCVRASLLQGDIELKAEKYKAAIEAYQQVKAQDADFLSEIIAPLSICYMRLGEEKKLFHYLEDCLRVFPQASLVLALVDLVERSEGSEAAVYYMANQLRQRSSLRGLQRLIALQLKTAMASAKENLLLLQTLTDQLLKDTSAYRCAHCGFSSKTLHWLCPSCRYWSTVKPI